MRKVDNDFQLQLEDISDDEFPLETSVEIELEDIRLAMHLLSSRISVKMTWRSNVSLELEDISDDDTQI